MFGAQMYSQKINGFQNQESRNRFIEEMPKAELHVHIEGTMTKDLLEKLSAEQKLDLPADFFGAKGNILWQDLHSFVNAYDKASSVVSSKAAYKEIVYDYLKRSAEEGVIYTEITISPQHMARLDVSYEDTVAATVDAILQVKSDGYAIDACILVVIVRHQGMINPAWATNHDDAVQAAGELVSKIIKHREEKNYGYQHIVGIGLAGAEVQFPIRLFKDALKRAADAGLKLTAHAGEFSDHKEVCAAIDMGVTRIGHGIYAAFDEFTLSKVIEKKIHLELCLSSNFNLVPSSCYPKTYQQLLHAITILHAHGVRYSINTDDPPFFLDRQGRLVTMSTEIEEACALLNELTPAGLIKIQRCAIEDSFAPEEMKVGLLQTLNAFAQTKGLMNEEPATSLAFQP